MLKTFRLAGDVQQLCAACAEVKRRGGGGGELLSRGTEDAGVCQGRCLGGKYVAVGHGGMPGCVCFIRIWLWAAERGGGKIGLTPRHKHRQP